MSWVAKAGVSDLCKGADRAEQFRASRILLFVMPFVWDGVWTERFELLASKALVASRNAAATSVHRSLTTSACRYGNKSVYTSRSKPPGRVVLDSDGLLPHSEADSKSSSQLTLLAKREVLRQELRKRSSHVCAIAREVFDGPEGVGEALPGTGTTGLR